LRGRFRLRNRSEDPSAQDHALDPGHVAPRNSDPNVTNPSWLLGRLRAPDFQVIPVSLRGDSSGTRRRPLRNATDMTRQCEETPKDHILMCLFLGCDAPSDLLLKTSAATEAYLRVIPQKCCQTGEVREKSTMSINVAGQTHSLQEALVRLINYPCKTPVAFDFPGSGEHGRLTADEVERTRKISSRVSNSELVLFVEAASSAPWVDSRADLADAGPRGELFTAMTDLYWHFSETAPKRAAGTVERI